MPRRGSPYGPGYERSRARLLAGRPPCHVCGAAATEADHVPPLVSHAHRDGSGCCRLEPACGPCQRAQGRQLQLERMGHPGTVVRPPPPAPSRVW